MLDRAVRPKPSDGATRLMSVGLQSECNSLNPNEFGSEKILADALLLATSRIEGGSISSTTTGA